ncbi:imidazole glycerol pho, partial [Trametes versicolor FP-101664 SS1]
MSGQGLYLLDYGAGNVQSLANSLNKLGHSFQCISSPEDFDKATSLIFPGVGAFESAIDGLISRGLYEPLREYIASGKPYFGICIGMQVLFRSSLESPTSTGLGIVPSDIGLFSNVDKSVPHMGWNSVEFLDPAETAHEGIDPAARYYFVHSFRAPYDWEHADAAQWAHTTTQYGQEIFLATVRKGNVFACQFHPEKSGKAGLRVLDAWLRSSEAERATSPPTPRIARHPNPKDGFTKRVVACMDVRSNDAGDLVVTKGDQYDVRERTSADGVQAQAAGEVRNLGKPVALAARYYEEGADELCLMNITSFRHSPLLDQPMLAVVRAAAETVYVPLTIGGGIKDTVDPDGTPHSALEVAGTYFRAGAT